MVGLTFCCCHISAKSQASDHCMAPVYKTDVNMLTFTLVLPCPCDPMMQLQCAAFFIKAFFHQCFTRTIFNLNPLSALTCLPSSCEFCLLNHVLYLDLQCCPNLPVTYNTGNKHSCCLSFLTITLFNLLLLFFYRCNTQRERV